MGEGRLSKWRTQYWPERGVTPGAGKKGCLPPSTYTDPDPVPRTADQRGGTAAWGHNLSGNWQQGWGQEGGWECTAPGSDGVPGWRGPRGKLLPAACPRGVMRGNCEPGGGGRRRGPRAGVSGARWTKR